MAEKKSKGTSKEIYVVREQEEEMIQFLLDGGSCILNGPNRIGKDNFYLGIKNRLEEGYQVAYSVEEALNTEAISILELDTNTVRETYPKNGTGTKLPFTRLLGKETGMTVPYIWVFNNFNKVLENEFVDKEALLSEIKELIITKGHAVWLISRYPLTEIVKEFKRDDCVIEQRYLGGFSVKEKEEFFRQFEADEDYQKVPETTRAEIREKVFEEYAGSHPGLLNYTAKLIRRRIKEVKKEIKKKGTSEFERKILLEERLKKEFTAERLEKLVWNELYAPDKERRENTSAISHLYYEWDKVLEAEEYQLSEKEKITNRKLYIRAFGEATGFEESRQRFWQEELYNKGHALCDAEGNYSPLAPHMVKYLDKWRKEELRYLMEVCDNVELGLRNLISKRLVEQRLTEYLTTPKTAGMYLKEYVRTKTKKEPAVKASSIEILLNEKKEESEENLILSSLAYENYYQIIKDLWEFPHFQSFTKSGEYESFFEQMNYKLHNPLLWCKQVEEMKQVISEGGEQLTNRKVSQIISEVHTIKDEYAELSTGLAYTDKHMNLCVSRMQKEAERLLNLSKKRNHSLSARDMEKYVSLAEKVLCAAKDLEVKNVAEGVLQKLADGKAEDAVADGTQIEKALLKNVVEGVINKNIISNCLTDLENKLVAYQNNSTTVAYEEIWDELVKLEESVKELHAVLYRKLNERRMSVHRVRNIAKHRNSLELLNIRRYTGLLKECNQFLADIEAENALLVPKLDKFYRCFRVDNPSDIKDGYAFGIFVPSHPEFPTVVGRIKKSHLGNASTRVEFQINSSLSWEWNDTAKLYDVWKKYS